MIYYHNKITLKHIQDEKSIYYLDDGHDVYHVYRL